MLSGKFRGLLILGYTLIELFLKRLCLPFRGQRPDPQRWLQSCGRHLRGDRGVCQCRHAGDAARWHTGEPGYSSHNGCRIHDKWISFFCLSFWSNEQDLDLLQLRPNTVYDGFAPDHPLIGWYGITPVFSLSSKVPFVLRVSIAPPVCLPFC